MQRYDFTERMRTVLVMAREEAVGLHHEYVGTEHLLLGLIREGEGVAAAVLQNLGVDLDALRATVESTVRTGDPDRRTGPDLPYTSRAKKVLELAMSEARELNHSYVGTEHLLLGLIHEKKGIAALVLAQHGVGPESAHDEVVRLLAPNPDPGDRSGRPRRAELGAGGTRPPTAAGQPAPSCSKCGGPMQQGVVVGDATERYSGPGEWTPESSFWGGMRTQGRPRYRITTYRCERCGFLESYAREG